MKKTIIIALFCVVSSSFAQIITQTHLHPEPVSLAIECHYYGVDLSQCVLVNDRKIGDGPVIRNKYCPVMITEFNKLVPPRTLERWLGKKNIYFNSTEVQDLYKQMPDDWVKATANTLSVNEIAEHIKTYKLSTEDGLGFVIIPYTFNKYIERVSCYFVFFDIKTRDLLWVTTAQGASGGGGMVTHWTEGILNTTKCFIDKDYKIISNRFKN